MPAPIPLRRLAAITAVLFVLILAFLAGRVHGGADPAQAGTPAARVSPATTPEPQESEQYGDDPSGQSFPGEQDEGSAPQQSAPPGQGTAPSPGGQDFDPPMTHAS